jgi:hypothetical protein
MRNIQDYVDKAKISVSQRKIYVAQFIDDFRRTKNTDLIQVEVTGDDPVTKLFEAVAHQLCI